MSDIDKIIELNSYKGIRDQDGWETLELTVRDNHSRVLADSILERLDDDAGYDMTPVHYVYR